MSKKTLYKMLAFMLVSFSLLAVVIYTELNPGLLDSQSDASVDALSNSVSTDEIITDSTNDDTSDQLSQQGNRKEPDSSEDGLLESQDANNDNINNEPGNREENSSEDDSDNQDNAVMVFTGDIYMSDSVLNQYNQNGINGILSPELQKEIKNADIAMANQEFPFSDRGTQMKDKQYTFRINPKYVKAFEDMQLDIVTLANNHVLDYGTDALVDTLDTLKVANIQYVGAGNDIAEAKMTRYFEIKNKTVAVLGASRVIPVTDWNAGVNHPGLLTTYDPTALIDEIKSAKEKSDYVVVYVHWGIEKKNKPEAYQRSLAKQYIDAGADLVIGSHPHVLQGIEYYKGKPIIYSLGNFMFYNSIKQTALLKASFLEEDGIQIQLLPCKADNSYTSMIQDEDEKSEFYKYITDISYQISFNKDGMIND